MQKYEKGSKKLINAWAMYDWANSVYSLVITAAVFPIYYDAVTTIKEGDQIVSDKVSFFGMEFVNAALYSYAISFSFLVLVFIMPIVSSIADYTGKQKRFMQFFCYLGAISCGILFFFTGRDNIELGIIASVMASIGFAGSLVFYNAYLPVVALPEQQDKVSARGFAMGYIGSVILLVFNLAMILQPALFGITDPSLPARISFVTVAIWWISFAQITFYHMPDNVFDKKSEGNVFLNGFKELKKVFKQVVAIPRLRLFIPGFFFYSMGVLTVIYLASIFGSKELQLESSFLIITILVIQLVAVVGALLFARISPKIGNISTIMLAVAFWSLICFAGYFVYDKWSFIALAVGVGMVMGGIQALSRSTYAKLLPKETEDLASFFSFYDVAEKLATVLGTLTFGVLVEITGGMRTSLLALVTYFVIGFIFMFLLRKLVKGMPGVEP